MFDPVSGFPFFRDWRNSEIASLVRACPQQGRQKRDMVIRQNKPTVPVPTQFLVDSRIHATWQMRSTDKKIGACPILSMITGRASRSE